MKNKELTKSTSEVLAAQVVAYKLIRSDNLKINAKKCMEELSKRKALGDSFDYEGYIQEKTNIDLPKKIDYSQVATIFNQAKNGR